MISGDDGGIPDLNEEGFRPPGIHRINLTDFRERFAIFNRSDRRLRVYGQLERFIAEVTKSVIVKRILVGGSFVTARPEPNDFDCYSGARPQ